MSNEHFLLNYDIFKKITCFIVPKSTIVATICILQLIKMYTLLINSALFKEKYSIKKNKKYYVL